MTWGISKNESGRIFLPICHRSDSKMMAHRPNKTPRCIVFGSHGICLFILILNLFQVFTILEMSFKSGSGPAL